MTELFDIRLASKQTAFTEIPVIDISSLINGKNPLNVASQIGDACEKVGFFYIKNHGIDPVSYTHLTLPTIYSV